MDNDIVKNVVKEIIKECNKAEIAVDPGFCSFYVKLLMIDPNWGITQNIMQIRSDLQKLIEFVVSKLGDQKQPDMTTLGIQYHFESHFDYLEGIAKQHRIERERLLMPLKVAVLEPSFYDKCQIYSLIRKFVCYIILASGLGDPKDDKVYREVQAVFSSVCNVDELIDYTNSLYTVRMEKVKNLVKVVSGIRLYNRDCQRGGEGIDDLPGLLFEALHAVKVRISATNLISRRKISFLIEKIQSYYTINNAPYTIVMDENIPKGSKESDLKYCKSLLLVYEQYYDALGKLYQGVEKLEKAAQTADNNRQEILEFLHRKIIPNMHLRCSSIFPVFESLFDEWTQLQDLTIKLVGLKKFFEHLHKMIAMLKSENILLDNSAKQPEKIEDHTNVHAREFEKPVDSECKIFRKELISSWRKLKYEFAGHCCWTMVLTKGLLIKGNEDLGIVKYKQYFYIFSSPLGVQSFIRNPEYYIAHVLNIARNNCEFIHYLRLKNQLVQLQNRKKLVEDEKEHVETRDSQTSVDTHLETASGFRRNYDSNVWNLRRRVLKLVKLRQCKTSSTQTERSFSIDTIGLQTWQLKECSTQTMVENYSNTPTPLKFLSGLRGRKDAQQLLLDLTYCEFKPLGDCHNKK